MKTTSSLLLVSSIVASATTAAAQATPPPPAVQTAPPPAAPLPPPAALQSETPMPGPTDAPAARTGFQMGLRTGYAVPLGKLAGGARGDMSDFTTGQVPIFVEIGGKIVPNFFLGGYLGLGFGGAAGFMDSVCTGSNLTCVAVGVRFGIEAQYHVVPAGKVNPWIGYGFGFESLGVSGSRGGNTQTVSVSGLEYAHFMGGVDFRLSRIVGLGPIVDFSMGQYSKVRSEATGEPTVDDDIADQAAHQWLSLGLRVVFFP